MEKWQEICSGALPVHVGIYRSRGARVHISVSLDRARLACAALRGSYSSSFLYYSQDLSDDVSRKQNIVQNIDRAIEEKWIRLYLQPVVRSSTGLTCSVEALARWVDPEKGFLSPADFIPALEEAGLIHRLDLHMLDLVLDAVRMQEAAGFSVIPHSINLSRADFTACDMVETFRQRVDAAGVSRDRIAVEITESVIGRDFDFMKEQAEPHRKGPGVA